MDIRFWRKWAIFVRQKRSQSALDRKALAVENRKVRMLKHSVDAAYALILQADISVDEALDIANATKRRALRLFPDKEETYDLIYAPRLFRAVAERFGRSDNGGPHDTTSDQSREKRATTT
jgi:hypothetical protein